MKTLLLFLCNTFLLFFLVNAQTPTWSGDIARIIYANCTQCHHTGGLAPTSFMSYQEAEALKFQINNAISNNRMPPWPADPNYKHYAHEMVLSQSEITAINQWVTNGAPAGNLQVAPAPPVYNNNTQLGVPDLSLQMPTYTVTSNNDVYRNFVLPTGLTQTKYATAIEVIPGNPQIVHHVLVFMDTSNNTINGGSGGGTGSNASNLIYGYVPGSQPYFTPPGTGFRFTPNTRIILQIHYSPGSSGQMDDTRVNFKLSTAAQREIMVLPLLNHFTSMTNGTIRFVNVPKWDFHWQQNYVFHNAVKLPSGSTLKARAFYDNTVNNPDNPNSPPKNVSAGEGTTDEMMMVFFAFMPYQSGDENLIIDKRILPRSGTTFCSGSSVLLETIEGNGYTYQWYNSGSPINAATAASYTATQSGSYTVSITLGSNNAVSDPIVVTVNNPPVATITPSGSAVIPQGGSVTLNASTGTGYTYQWYRNDTILSTGATSATYDATVPGNYTVQVYNGCFATSVPVTLTSAIATYSISASANPTVGGSITGAGSYTSGTSVTLTTFASNGYTFIDWTENGTSVNANTTYSFTATGNKNLVANFATTTSAGDLNSDNSIAIFPNPSSGLVNIKSDKPFDVRVFNAVGQLVSTNKLTSTNSQIEIKDAGVYLLQITDSTGLRINKRLFIE